MASEIRVNNIKALTGLGTVTISSDGINVGAGIITANNFKGGVELTSGSLTGISTIGVTTITATTLTVNGSAYPSAGPLSNRNLIINGDMRVAQRSTGILTTSDNVNEGYQTIDRYGFSFGSGHGGSISIGQTATVPSGQGFTKSWFGNVESGVTPTSTQTTSIYTKIEAQDIANSGWDYTSTSSYITLSFWARSSKAGTYCVFVDSQDAATYEKYIKEYTLVADTWKKVTVVVPGKATLAYDDDNGEGMQVQWTLSTGRNAGTDSTWQTGDEQATSNQVNFFDTAGNQFFLTGVQLEVGSVATPFEHRSYGDDLARCQRYFYKHDLTEGSSTIAHGHCATTTLFIGVIAAPVSFRDTPSVSSSGSFEVVDGTSSFTPSSITLNNNSPTNAFVQVRGAISGATQGRGALLRPAGDSSATFTLSSEL